MDNRPDIVKTDTNLTKQNMLYKRHNALSYAQMCVTNILFLTSTSPKMFHTTTLLHKPIITPNVSIHFLSTKDSIFTTPKASLNFKTKAFINEKALNSAHYNSLRVLEWDKLTDSVSSFAATSLGREATKAQLWSLDQTYEQSLRLLEETNAAVEMHKHGGCSLDFSNVDVSLVRSAIQHVQKGLPVEGNEAMSVVSMLQLAEVLQSDLKASIKEDADWYRRFMPLTELILDMIINRSLVKLIQQVVDEDGSVKDSASPTLKQLRNQVRILEKKLNQLVNSLIKDDRTEASFLEVIEIDGRWCVKSSADPLMKFEGLLLSSGSAMESIVEPLSAVPLNDELQQARALMANAERDVLLSLTEKMQTNINDITQLLEAVVKLDVINARATFGLSFKGTCPDLFLPEDRKCTSTMKALSEDRSLKREWLIYLPKAYHPLLVQQHRKSLKKAREDVKNATSEIRRRKLQGRKEEPDIDISFLEMQVSALEQSQPVPVDFTIASRTRVLVITGPNTGGKTIGLKTVGLTALMAKSGLHILSSESARIPWFDSVFADIGDEQSLSQSLSTFSGHLKQISDIRSQSTSQSLVLLDEVGAGTNPLEGAALGMSLLESFAESGALLTIATTHHGELKTLKYSNDAFENACMEFDEVDLKPTYRILWGIPGRSNAINVSERLGLPRTIVDKARALHGAASEEINELITDMEKCKQDFQELVSKAEYHLRLSRDSYDRLLISNKKIMDHVNRLRQRKIQEICDAGAMARSIIHTKARQQRASTSQALQSTKAVKASHKSSVNRETTNETTKADNDTYPIPTMNSLPNEASKQSQLDKNIKHPKVGDYILISSLGKKATVLGVDLAKQEVLVQAGIIKMKLKLSDIKA